MVIKIIKIFLYIKMAIIMFGIIFVIIIICVILLIFLNINNEKCPSGKVCIPMQTWANTQNLRQVPQQIYTEKPNRDLEVLQNPLYPPLNRTDKQTYNSVVYQTEQRNINIPTQNFNDSFRLVGYLTNNDDPVRSWKLMAREKNRNESEFYMIPANNNYDMKIPITTDITPGQRIRDLYTIPNEIKFNTPILAETPYTFLELPKETFD